MSAIATVRALTCAAGQFKEGGYSMALGAGFSCVLLDTGSVKWWAAVVFLQSADDCTATPAQPLSEHRDMCCACRPCAQGDVTAS
eukprot:1917852-Rhodomonas_salina.4